MEKLLSSGLFECRVMHARLAPREHRFLYRIFLFAIDLDELEELPRRLRLFSLGRRNLYSFRERDYLPVDEPLHPAPSSADSTKHSSVPASAMGLKSRVQAFAAQHGTDLTGGRVVLVTLPRVFGYLFNPVSFYFCYTPDGAPAAVIAEVTNTFREVKPYFLGASTRSSSGSEFRLRVPKHFYVSPFSDVDVEFDFTLRAPHDRLALQIDDFTDDARTLTTTLTGQRRELTSARLWWFTLKYPLLTLRVIALIHWHAFLLWCKRVPWFAKSARAAEQRGLHRPHHSLHSPEPRAAITAPAGAPGVSLPASDVA